MRTTCFTLLLLGLSACAGSPNPGVTGCQGCDLDGGKPDGGKVDGGERPRDAGSPDAGQADAGSTDAGLDGGLEDGGIDAGYDAGPLSGNVCPAGSFSFSGTVHDLCATQSLGAPVPVAGAQAATLEPYAADVSDANGKYTICLRPNTPTTVFFSKAGYVDSYLAEILMVTQVPIDPAFGGVQLACTSLLKNYALENPALDPTMGLVLSAVVSATLEPPCDPADAGYSGWTFEALPLDGGSGGPWPTAYVDPAGDLQSVASTFSDGTALMYDIDPSVLYVTVTATNPIVGNDCGNLDVAGGFTGRAYVTAGAFTLFPWAVP